MTAELCSTARTRCCAFAAGSQPVFTLTCALRVVRSAFVWSDGCPGWRLLNSRSSQCMVRVADEARGKGFRPRPARGMAPRVSGSQQSARSRPSPMTAQRRCVLAHSSPCHAASPVAACRCPARASLIRNITALPSNLASSLRRRSEQRMPERSGARPLDRRCVLPVRARDGKRDGVQTLQARLQ